MTKILQINSSLFAEQGVSSTLADQFVQGWLEREPDSQLQKRDLSAQPVPHLDSDRLSALMTPAEQRSPAQQAMVDYADELINEVQQADVLVLGLPMYNFSVPSTVKAWFDHIARAGVTFRYTDNGPEGLLHGKKAYVFTTRGGRHRNRPEDNQVPLVATFLAFLGITDVEFIYAEGLNMGDEHKRQGLAAASNCIETLLAA
ncbi:MAG: NAD(P)H-dependent oxidoreductase [Candidatus Competibacteraceae bacterium]|nr:NAD(P)H-dependent oxidoreductase [Candidatus Competibacteraceae bacterium]MCB1807370.1 NAD(P)H-dependent oxidoreductase [Candidatus Competibacteraceae bacterium]MCB1811111.1 NAD(P)H-dependent oxidoreductase [Candidatus Competibacteraceae bacterium]